MNKNIKNAWSSPVRLAFGVGLAFCLLAEAQAESLLTTNGTWFAWPDTEVPGQPGVYLGGNIDFPTAAEDGTLLFRADLYGAGTSGVNGRALFTGASAATLSMLARWSDPAPGLPGLSLYGNAVSQGIQSAALISPSGGYTLWSSYLSGTGVGPSNDSALFRSSPSGHLLVAREGSPAPGTAGALFSGNLLSSWQFTQVNRNGTVLFQTALAGGDVSGTTNNGALYTGTPGALSIVRRIGDTVLTGPVTAAGLGYVQHLDNTGRVLYDLPLAGSGVTPANDNSLWFYTPGSGSTLLLREGDPAPGTAGATFGNSLNSWIPGVSQTSLTRSGKYEFVSDLVGGDAVPGANDRALYVSSVTGGPTMIARSGDPAPGTDAFFKGFSPFYSLINDAGVVAFQATLTGGTSDEPNDTGIWIWNAGTLSKIVREGDPVPGIAGATYDSFIGWVMAFNDQGQILITANLLNGDVVGGFNDRQLLAWDPIKGLFLVARSGEEIEGAPGDVRTISGWSYIQYSNTDGVSHGLGKTGRVALSVYFFDGEAVATVDVDCYPPTNYGIDGDGDGYGDPATRVSVCSGATPPGGYVANATDCNDANPAVHAAYYQDADADGYGNPFASVCVGTTPPAGYLTSNTDCDDTLSAVHPGASDANCDGIDNNCNGFIDDRFAPQPTTCGVGNCFRTGETSCDNGSLVNSCVPGAPSTESCNGLDDNCDGAVDNAAAPTGAPAVALQKLAGNSARLSWPAVPVATGYDVVRGSLQSLRTSGGNFSAATSDCYRNDLTATTVDDATVPAVGQGIWYLLRATNCGGSASYNSAASSQSGSRDAEIAASGHACP